MSFVKYDHYERDFLILDESKKELANDPSTIEGIFGFISPLDYFRGRIVSVR